MTYREYIEKMRKEWIGKMVEYQGERYMVVGVDYNGALLIDREARYTRETAISTFDVEIVK